MKLINIPKIYHLSCHKVYYSVIIDLSADASRLQPVWLTTHLMTESIRFNTNAEQICIALTNPFPR